MGFGNEEDEGGNSRQWIGLSGDISLVKGLPLTGSVEGLKFSWNPEAEFPSENIKTTLTGIGVDR